MSGYQRFLPRDETRTAANVAAEVAEAAEVEALQGLRTAEALLKSAEVRPKHRPLQQASAELQQRPGSGIPELQQLQQLQQAPGPGIVETRYRNAGSHAQPSHPEADGGSARPYIPSQWCGGVLRLGAMPPPRHCPEHAWKQLIVDAERFLDSWAPQAAGFGWRDWELFGCHRGAPWGRIQGMGLVLLLRGKELAALTESEAVIRTQAGARQTYRRKRFDPLHPVERCLVWDLS